MLGRQVVRSLSTSSVRGAVVKTPIPVHGVEGRYAGALYSAASKEKKLDTVEKQLNDLKSLYDSDKKFREFVLDPTLKKSAKKGAMEAILAKRGADPITTNFLGLVAENGRLGKLEAIVKTFSSVMSAHRGEVPCSVISAKPLDSGTMGQLEGVLKSFLKPGQTIHLTTSVDPGLVGGLIVNIGDKYVDMSLASKFRHYEQLIAQAV